MAEEFKFTTTPFAPEVKADTVHKTEVYGRPPLPYDPVASSMRSSQELRCAGLLMMTVGTEGSSGLRVSTVALVAVGFEAQIALLP